MRLEFAGARGSVIVGNGSVGSGAGGGVNTDSGSGIWAETCVFVSEFADSVKEVVGISVAELGNCSWLGAIVTSAMASNASKSSALKSIGSIVGLLGGPSLGCLNLRLPVMG